MDRLAPVKYTNRGGTPQATLHGNFNIILGADSQRHIDRFGPALILEHASLNSSSSFLPLSLESSTALAAGQVAIAGALPGSHCIDADVSTTGCGGLPTGVRSGRPAVVSGCVSVSLPLAGAITSQGDGKATSTQTSVQNNSTTHHPESTRFAACILHASRASGLCGEQTCKFGHLPVPKSGRLHRS